MTSKIGNVQAKVVLDKIVEQKKVVIDKIVEQKDLSILHVKDIIQYLAGYSIFLCTLIGVGLVRHIYSPLGYWFGFIYAYFGIPLIDFMMGEDVENPTGEKSRELSKNVMFIVLLLIYLPIQSLFLLWTLYHFSRNYESMSWFSIVGFALSIGTTVSGMGFNIAHELFHKINSPLEVAAGIALLFQGMYSHFFIEHVWGHHKNVATELDPASCFRGETIYTYIPRSVMGGYIDAWRIEFKRLKSKNQNWLSLNNRMILFTLIQLIICFLVKLVFGLRGLCFYIAESIFAVIILEAVNYIEHYGLSRKKLNDGSFEPVNVLHSWNAPQFFSNCVLFKLQRHSDHHAFPLKRYQVLCSHDVSPKLPFSYPMLLLMVIFPPIYFSVVHPILDDLEEKIKYNNKESFEKKEIKSNKNDILNKKLI